MQLLHIRWGRRNAPHLGQVVTPGVSSFHTELRRLFRRCLDTLLLGTAIYDTSLGSCPGRANDSVFFIQPLRKRSQPWIGFGPAGAGAFVQVGPAAGTQSLAVRAADMLGIQGQHQRRGEQFVQIDFAVLQKDDRVVLLILQRLRQKSLYREGQLLPEGPEAAVALQVQNGLRRPYCARCRTPAPAG